MKTRTPPKSSSRRQQGVALIIVLAMLTILLALAITLSATTRAERGVVQVHTEVTNTRQLVHAAISRAMNDIELQAGSFLGAKGHSNAGWVGDGGPVIMSSYPRKRFVYAYTNPVAGHHLGVLSTNEMELLLSEESREFFTYHPVTQTQINLMTNTVSYPNAEDDFAHWMGLRMNRQRGDNSRFTYVAENLSDGIDVNHAFKDYEVGALSREYGRASSEVNWLPMWSKMGLENDVGQVAALESEVYNFANTFGRVDSMREINYYLPAALGKEPFQTYQFCTFSAEPALDRVFVMLPDGTPQMVTIEKSGTDLRVVDVSGTVAEWEARVADLDVALGTAFKLCQVRGDRPAFTLDQLRGLIGCLKDYVDPDVYVTEETLASVEPVPMFNEMAFSAKLTDVARLSREEYTYTVDLIPVFELWWPFVVEDGESFSLDVDAQVTITVIGKNADGTDVNDVNESTVKMKKIDPFSSLIGSLADPFMVISNAYPVEASSSVVLNETNNLLTRIEVSVNFTGMKIVQGSETCDSVSGVTYDTVLQYAANTPPIAVSPVPDGEGASPLPRRSKEIVDPRFNHAAADWDVLNQMPYHSLGLLNTNTLDFWINNPDCDVRIPAAVGVDSTNPETYLPHTPMYCRNEPMDVVGEMGFLPISPWRTIRLLAKTDGEYHRLGEFFTATNRVDQQILIDNGLDNPRGKVNVNGNDLALASAFFDVPIELYPGQTLNPGATLPAPQRFDDLTTAIEFGRRLGLVRANSPARAFISEWDLGSLDLIRPAFFDDSTIFDNGALSPTSTESGLSEFEIEAFFRNTMGLLTTRNNLFTVEVMVQSLSDLGAPTSTIRAVATVWRDGLPSEFVQDGSSFRGVHPWFIQNITYLTDYED